MTFGRRLVAAAVCVPLLVVGCADDPKPKVAPPTETPTSSSPSATPTPAAVGEEDQRWCCCVREALGGDVQSGNAVSASRPIAS